MTTRGSALLLGAAALVLLANVSTALGAGKITGLTLNPFDVKTCTFETITVRGTGKCSDVTVFFGDGNKLITLGKPKPFPQTFHHVYSKGGLTRLSAQAYTGPGSTCTGKAGKTVQIAAGPSPTITSTSFFSLGSQITPGADILLYGQFFGDVPGQVWIHLNDYQGNPVNRQLLYTDTHWSDTFVAGQIPPDISKVLNQQATLTVVAQCGAVSNAATVDFTANIDVVDLAQHTDRLDCSISPGASVSDQCMGWGGSQWPPECGLTTWFLPTDFGLGGYHASGYGFHGNGGNDQFWVTAPLQYGWVLDSSSADWRFKVGDVSQASKDPNASSAPGDASPRLGVNWYVGNCGMVGYFGSMIIVGPVGVPY